VGSEPRKKREKDLAGFVVRDDHGIGWSDDYVPGETPFDELGVPRRDFQKKPVAARPSARAAEATSRMPEPQPEPLSIASSDSTLSASSARTKVPSIRDSVGPDTQDLVNNALSSDNGSATDGVALGFTKALMQGRGSIPTRQAPGSLLARSRQNDAPREPSPGLNFDEDELHSRRSRTRATGSISPLLPGKGGASLMPQPEDGKPRTHATGLMSPLLPGKGGASLMPQPETEKPRTHATGLMSPLLPRKGGASLMPQPDQEETPRKRPRQAVSKALFLGPERRHPSESLPRMPVFGSTPPPGNDDHDSLYDYPSDIQGPFVRRPLPSGRSSTQATFVEPLYGDPPAPTGVERKRRFNYPEYLKDGLFVVAALAWRHARMRGDAVVNKLKEDRWKQLAVTLLSSMYTDVLHHLVAGNIAEAYEQGSPTLQNVYRKSNWLANSTGDAPCVYARILCNVENGKSPTPNQLRRVILRLRRYISQDPACIDDALAIDNLFGTNSRQKDIERGDHYFLRAATGNRIPKRCYQVQLFCDKLEERFAKLRDGDEDKPLEHALHYVGYAMCFARRKTQHEADNGSSSWFMNLVKAVCRAELTGTTWGFSDFVVCYCADEDEVPVAELLITLLSNASHDTGGGFEVHPAGLNISSAGSATKALWQKCQAFRLKDSPFEKNRVREAQKIVEYPAKWQARVHDATEGLPAQRREIWKVREQIAQLEEARRKKITEQVDTSKAWLSINGKHIPEKWRLDMEGAIDQVKQEYGELLTNSAEEPEQRLTSSEEDNDRETVIESVEQAHGNAQDVAASRAESPDIQVTYRY
jgi:hypothetical protein